MICRNCGNSLPDGSNFCDKCGAGIEPEYINDVKISEDTPDINVKPKKSHIRAIVIIALVVITAAATCIVLFLPGVRNTVKKTVMSDEKYFKSVNKSDLSKKLSFLTSDSSEISVTGADSDKYRQCGTLEFELCDNSSELLNSLNLTWLKSISGSFNAFVNDSATKVDLNINVNGSDIGSVEYLCDKENENIFFNVPEYNESYLRLTKDYMADEYDITDPVLFENDAFLFENNNINPFFSEDIISELKKYLNLFIDSLKDIAILNNEEFSCGEITKSCTKAAVSLSVENLKDILSKISLELRNDKVFEEIYHRELEKYVKEKRDISFSGFMDEIDKEIQNISNDNYKELIINEWIDNCGNVAGIEIYKDDVPQFKLSFIYENKDFAFEFCDGYFDPAENCYYNGYFLNGQINDDLCNATLTVKTGKNEEVFKINNFSLSCFMQGSTKFELIYSPDFLDDSTVIILKSDESELEKNYILQCESDGLPIFNLNVNWKLQDFGETVGFPDNCVGNIGDWLDKLDYKPMILNMLDSGITTDFIMEILGIK